jgi:hypothetical protein
VRGLTAHLARRDYGRGNWEGDTISANSKVFDDCVILSKDAFDPDAVFQEDIVDDDVLPYVSLEVDGLTTSREGRNHGLELRPEDVAANDDVFAPDTTMPVAALDPNELEVYGWESSFWKKIKGYLGF